MKSNKMLKIFTIITGVLTAVISGLMNFYYIPIIEDGPVSRVFDMNLGYNYWEAQYFLDCLTPIGKEVYLHYQLPLDFVYPLVYCAFFILLFRLLLKKHTPIIILPALLALTDYCENVCILILLRSETFTEGFVAFASVVTIIKTVLMWLCFAAVILITAILIRKKLKADPEWQACKQERKAKREAKREARKAEKEARKLAAAEEKKAQAEAKEAEADAAQPDEPAEEADVSEPDGTAEKEADISEPLKADEEEADVSEPDAAEEEAPETVEKTVPEPAGTGTDEAAKEAVDNE